MTTITEIGTVLQELLKGIADEEGRASGFIKRRRKLSGSRYAQALVFGWMSKPNGSLSELAQAAGTIGVHISKQGLAERFSEQSAEFMQRLLQRGMRQLIEGEAVRVGVFANFASVHVQDSTSIRLPEALRSVWPGCNGRGTSSAGLKISVDWDLVRGSLTGVHLQAAKAHDQHASLAQQLPPVNSLQLRDLGYFNLKHFAKQNATGSYFLSRLKVSAKLYTLDGQALDWVNVLLTCPDQELDQQVLIGAHRLPCRLLAWRVPESVAHQRQQRLQATADDHTRPVSPWRWQSAAWSVYITNTPPALLALPQAQVLVKVRWQIELLFKLWKSHGLLDEWRTTDPWRILTECFAKLLALLIQHWCTLLSARDLPTYSLVLAHHLLQKHAFHLAAVLADLPLLLRALSVIQAALSVCKRSASRQRPATFQAVVRGTLA